MSWKDFIAIVIVGLLIFMLVENRRLTMAKQVALQGLGKKISIGNPEPIKLTPPHTSILTKRVIVSSAGTPVRFPKGKVVGSKVRLSTRGNTGTVYLSEGSTTAKEGVIRFGIVKDSNIPYDVSDRFELSRLWVDSDNDDDAIEILAEVESVQ